MPVNNSVSAILAWEHGVIPDGRDCSDALESLCLSGIEPRIYLGPGDFTLSRPTNIGTAHLLGCGAPADLQSYGKGSTVILAPQGQPGLVAGFPDVQGGKSIGPEHRPKLDAIGGDGTATGWGFATRGAVMAVGICNTATMGGAHPRLYGTTDDFKCQDFTLEVMLAPGDGGQFKASDPLLGFPNDGPFLVAVDGENQRIVRFIFRTISADAIPGDDGTLHVLNINLGDDRWPVRLRWAVSCSTGQVSMSSNGQDRGTFALDAIKGRWLRPNPGTPFMIGGTANIVPLGTGCADIIVGGLRFSRDFRPDGGTDSSRYLGLFDPGMLWYLDTTAPPQGRYLPIQAGSMGSHRRGSFFLVSADAPLKGIMGGSIRDMAVRFGAPSVALGSVLSYRCERFKFVDGTGGIYNIPLGANYPIDLLDGWVGGDDSAINLSSCIVRADRVDVRGFRGSAAIRLRGCDWVNRDGWVYYCSPRTYWIYDIRTNDYGGFTQVEGLNVQTVVKNLMTDNEDTPILGAIFRLEPSYANPTRVYLSDIYAADVHPEGAWVELHGNTGAGGPGWPLAAIKAERFAVGWCKRPVRSFGNAWQGMVDTAGNVGVETPVLTPVPETGGPS